METSEHIQRKSVNIKENKEHKKYIEEHEKHKENKSTTS